MSLIVLSAGRDPSLLNSRNAVMQHVGCTVKSVVSAAQIVEQIFEGDYDVIVLCHTIPAPERDKVLGVVERYRPSARVIVVTNYWDSAVPASPIAEKVSAEPVAIIKAIQRYFPQRGGSA